MFLSALALKPVFVFKQRTFAGRRLTNVQIERLKDITPSIRASLIKGLERFKSRVEYNKLLAAIIDGKIKDIEEIAEWKRLQDDMMEMKLLQRELLIDSAQASTVLLPRVVRPDFAFNPLNPRINRWINKFIGNRIQDVTDEMKAAVRSMVRIAFRKAMPPRQAGALIRDTIGLNRRQAVSLMNYASRLMETDITRNEFKRLIESAYEKKLTYRADMIARTEAANAMNAGTNEMIAQAVEQGIIDPQLSVRRWIALPGACHYCEEMDGTTVGIDEPWSTPLGDVMLPSEIHPNCNCVFELIPHTTES